MTLSKAEPTAEQAAHFARLAQIASDQFFSLLFGSRAQTVLESMFRQRDNDNSYLYTRFLLEGDSIAGMLQAYPAADARRNAARSNWMYLRYAGWQLPRALALGFAFRHLLEFLASNLDDGDFYIAMLAIYQPYRGRGRSKTLLNQAERQAAARGLTRLALDVDERNSVALAAYKRAGFEQSAQSKKVTLEGDTWGLLRLTKPIAPSQRAARAK